jgi:hypothetical protein
MKSLSDSEYSELWWLPFRSWLGISSEYVLSDRAGIVGRFKWEGPLARIFPSLARQATAVTGDGEWTFRWTRAWWSSKQSAAIFQRETGEEIARFSQQTSKTSRPPTGLLEVYGKSTFIWDPLDHRRLEAIWKV